MKIAVCFFGITRSTSFTIDSIRKNVLIPSSELGDVKVFCHFFNQRYITNSRSNESAELSTDEYKLLEPDQVEFDEPELFISQSDFEDVKKFGDIYNDDYSSIKNLFHQLYSLNKVTNMSLSWKPDVVIFARPDLQYLDNLKEELESTLLKNDTVIKVPNWQNCGGINDRFAIISGRQAIEAYGKRYLKALEYCKSKSKPIHSERLLKFALSNKKIERIPHRAVRVRANGEIVHENFINYRVMDFHNLIVNTFNLSIDNKFLWSLAWKVHKVILLFSKRKVDIKENIHSE